MEHGGGTIVEDGCGTTGRGGAGIRTVSFKSVQLGLRLINFVRFNFTFNHPSISRPIFMIHLH